MTERKRNLLFGRGEKLIRDGEFKRGGNGKPEPYTLAQQRAQFSGAVSGLQQLAATSTPSFAPRGEVAAKVTMQPQFLAKSFYPGSIIRETGLKLLGSRPVTVTPRKLLKGKDPVPMVTVELIFAGTQGGFRRFGEILRMDDPETKQWKVDICRMERVEAFDWDDRNRIQLETFNGVAEAVLHAGAGDQDIIRAFMHFLQEFGARTDESRLRNISTLTFAPVWLPEHATAEYINRLMDFTHLRVMRNMPEIFIDPEEDALDMFRESLHVPRLCDLPAKDDRQRAVIFDGGFSADLPWVKAMDASHTDKPISKGIEHGAHVTSAYLFGKVEEGELELPQPFTNVDHVRVLPGKESSVHVMDVLDGIVNTLKDARDKGRPYSLANISLGPRMPIVDDDVHGWTTRLDDFLSQGDLFLTVAAGNDGRHGVDLGRVQPPSDAVNAMAVGSSDSSGPDWNRAAYSCMGPGRSPGLVKPDLVTFGGTGANMLPLYCPLSGSVVTRSGTSFSSPLALRVAAGVQSDLEQAVSPITLHALLVSATEFDDKKHERSAVGWGRLPLDYDNVLYSDEDEVIVMYQGVIERGHPLRVPVPIPDGIPETKKVQIAATFVYRAVTDPAHPGNYTQSGLDIRFYKDGVNSKPFFANSMYDTEQELRNDAHKWDTCLHRKRGMTAKGLTNPCFVVDYQTREEGKPVSKSEERDLPFSLVVRVRVPGMNDIAQRISQRYDVLENVPLRVDVGAGEAELTSD